MTIGHIETHRLRIRSFQPNDWQAVYDYTSDPDVMMYIPEGPFTPEQAKAFVADNMSEQAHFVAVLLKTADMLVGHMEFHPWFASQTYEIGWVFNRAYHGYGYATEAAEEVVRYGFEDLALNRIHAKHFGSNPASGRVMRKVGMSLEGVRPEHYKKWETYEDRVDYGLLVRDWRKNKRG